MVAVHQNSVDCSNISMTQKYHIDCLVDQLLSPTRRYTRFGLGPIQEGQGLTIANNLRRALLDGVPGWGITSASLQGAKHEFMVLKGVRESVLEILLNLREVVLTNEFEVETKTLLGFLNKQGPCLVYAKDLVLPKGLTVVDPNQVIASISSDGQLAGEFRIEYGTKFNPKSFSSKTTPFLAIGGSFFPIKRVNYTIQKELNPITGEDNEYIFLELLTDNSIHPRRAILSAVDYLFDLFNPLKGYLV